MTVPAIPDLAERIERARNMVSMLCKRERDWIMSIPARPNEDPDLVIADGLRAGMDALEELSRLKAGEGEGWEKGYREGARSAAEYAVSAGYVKVGQGRALQEGVSEMAESVVGLPPAPGGRSDE